MSEFLSNVKMLRERARLHIEQGPVTAGYKADRQQVIAVLNVALATEIVCVLRYKRHYYMASGINAEPIAKEFFLHAKEEQMHADRIAQRITQLQGEPNFDPEGLAQRSHSEYVAGTSLVEMIREDLIAERIAVESYSEIIQWLGNDDPTTRNLIEDILKKEEEHAEDLSNMLKTFELENAPAQVKAAQL
ncbi:MAG TPA: ferritin-like domain-containing protein [Blastocatellia bacterium]|nr:ferritin-like domain-containing protein [Blastocatellia bacterium]